MSDDELRLLAAWRAGDRAAGRTLFTRYFSALHRFFRAKVPDVADDLAQAALLRCLETTDRVRDTGSFRAYMFAIARNELYGWYRHHRATLALDPESMTADEMVPSPSRAIGVKSERRLLLESLRRIPLDSQVLLELHYWGGLSSAELAGVLDAPPSTIRSRLARARAQLESQIAQLGSAMQLRTTTDDIDAWARRIGRYVHEDADAE